MIDAVVTATIALLSGLGVITSRLNTRINELDRRIDQVELRVATDYVSKVELNEMIERVETHMVRIETKLDKIIFK
jgi:hypothetical protein